MRRRKLYGILGALPTLTPACTSPLTADHQNIFKRFMSENQVLQTCKQSIQSTFKACLRQHAVNLSFALVVLMQHTVRGPDRLLRIHNKLYKKRATGKCGENVKKKNKHVKFYTRCLSTSKLFYFTYSVVFDVHAKTACDGEGSCPCSGETGRFRTQRKWNDVFIQLKRIIW